MDRTAECHCGSLRVIATGEPDRVYVCHCQACQRRTGAVVHSGAFYLKSQVRIEGGDKIYARDVGGVRKIRFHFCPNCGSNVFWESGLHTDYYGIAVGAFADPEFPPPTFSLWEESMHPWLVLPVKTVHYPQGRPVGAPKTGADGTPERLGGY